MYDRLFTLILILVRVDSLLPFDIFFESLWNQMNGLMICISDVTCFPLSIISVDKKVNIPIVLSKTINRSRT